MTDEKKGRVRVVPLRELILETAGELEKRCHDADVQALWQKLDDVLLGNDKEAALAALALALRVLAENCEGMSVLVTCAAVTQCATDLDVSMKPPGEIGARETVLRKGADDGQKLN
jgi:hypothetical protein